PYDNVPPEPWPGLLVTGSLHDPRVLIHEPAKWVAKLRAAAAPGGGARLLFRPELGSAAHTGPAGRYGRLGSEAAIPAFIVEPAAPPGRPLAQAMDAATAPGTPLASAEDEETGRRGG